MLLRTVAILRLYDPKRSQALALQCWSAGMDLVEVPVQGEWLGRPGCGVGHSRRPPFRSGHCAHPR